MNPLGELGYGFQLAHVKMKETCGDCRRSIAKAMADTIRSLQPKKEAKK